MLEVVVSYFVDERKWKRKTATILNGFLIYVLGLACAVSAFTLPFRGKDQGLLDIFDFITTNYMLPVGGLLTVLFIAWVVKDKVRIEEFGSSGMLYKGLKFVLKVITPIAVIIVILHGLELLPFMEYGN